MTARIAFSCYTALILLIFGLAYANLLPMHLINASWYDSAGHFVLYGLWGYFFGLAFSRPVFSIRKLSVGVAICIIIAIAEECMQAFSPYRSFSFSDMAFGLSGIVIAAFILNFQHKN